MRMVDTNRHIDRHRKVDEKQNSNKITNPNGTRSYQLQKSIPLTYRCTHIKAPPLVVSLRYASRSGLTSKNYSIRICGCTHEFRFDMVPESTLEGGPHLVSQAGLPLAWLGFMVDRSNMIKILGWGLKPASNFRCMTLWESDTLLSHVKFVEGIHFSSSMFYSIQNMFHEID